MSKQSKTAGKTAERRAAGAATELEVKATIGRWLNAAEKIIAEDATPANLVRRIAKKEGVDPVELIVGRLVVAERPGSVFSLDENIQYEKTLPKERIANRDNCKIADAIASFGCLHQNIYISDILDSRRKASALINRFYRRGDFSLEPAIRRAIVFALGRKGVEA